MLRVISSALMLVGAMLIAAQLWQTAYPAYEGYRLKQELAQAAQQARSGIAAAAVESLADAVDRAPRTAPQPLVSITIPAINVDSPVVEAPIVDGEWQVPRFVVGHLEGTALVGEGSNIVLAGHLQSLRNGNVFADLDKLRPGDAAFVYTPAGEVRYTVQESRLVVPTDVSVVGPTLEETLTLVTCAGTWDAREQSYTHRLIVTATPDTAAELQRR